MKRTASKNEKFHNLTIDDLRKKGFTESDSKIELERRLGIKHGEYLKYLVKEEDEEIIMVYGINETDIIVELL